MSTQTTSESILDPRDGRPEHQRALRAWLQLQAALGLDPERAVECLRQRPEPAAAMAIARARARLDERALVHAIDALVRSGTRALPWTSPLYPDPLRAIADPPPLLFVAGDPACLARPAVAIVGARAATTTGLEVARRTAERLAQAGIVVVSGLARGIDGAAHRGALEGGGQTIAVQACGPERIYPAEHRRLAAEIRECGVLMTELPVGAAPRRPYFPLRNRLISGLSSLVIVIEARERSGSLITAHHAAGQGRDVMALPGTITAPTSHGPNRLIRDGAACLLEPEDALRWLGIDPDEVAADVAGAASRVEEGASPEPARGEGLSRGAREVAELLAREPLGRDELGRRLGQEPEQLSLALVDLELSGAVRESRDGRIHLTLAAARRPKRSERS